jgi:hypothetical protein
VPHILDNEIDTSLSTLKSGIKNTGGGPLTSNASIMSSSSRSPLPLAPSTALVPFNGLQGINLQSMGIILDLGYKSPPPKYITPSLRSHGLHPRIPIIYIKSNKM